MQQILVYADSLSWGIIPGTRQRFAFEKRWPGVMQSELLQVGMSVRVIEDCLNGRRTAWEDPFKPGRNGLEGLEQRIEVNSPLSLVIVMLGTNDFQSVHQLDVWHSAQGIAAIVSAIRQAPIEPGMPVPDVLVVAPPPLQPATHFPPARRGSSVWRESRLHRIRPQPWHWRWRVHNHYADENQNPDLQIGCTYPRQPSTLLQGSLRRGCQAT